MRILYVIGCLSILYACKKENPNAAINTGGASTNKVKLNWHNVVGADSLILNTGTYLNQNGDTFTVGVWKYYISNIALIKTDNTTYTEQESYHLMNASNPASMTVSLHQVPVGTYKSIRFTIGVDSARNVSGAQTGALDPVHNMFWSWSTGYIFTMLEGTSPQSPVGDIGFHIAGFSGTYNALKTVTLNFPVNMVVTSQNNPRAHIVTNVVEMFDSPNIVKFGATYKVLSVGPQSKAIADNYADMFSVSAIED